MSALTGYIVFQLINGKLLRRDNAFYYITDRYYTYQLFVIQDRKV